jgi:hypothetical protein
MKKLSLLFAFLLTLFGGTQAWADELTVYDETDTTNKYVPFYGYYGDEVQKNQMIFPADVLEGLKGKNIVSMTFYCNSFGYSGKGDMTNWIVSLGETEANTLNNLDTETNLSQVFSGTITPNTTDKIVTITFDLPYSYLGSNLLVEFNHPTASGYYDITFKGKEVSSAAYAYNASRNFLPRTTFGYEDIIEGPGLAVFDGNSKLATGHSYNFGLATAGTEKAFTLKNTGTESVTVNIAATGGYGVSPTTATIAAGAEATLKVTMPTSTAQGAVTITPTASSVDAFTINVSGTVRDADKVYESGFTALPQDWTTTGSWYYSEANGAYTTSYYLSNNSRLITPKLTIAEGEKFFVEAKGYSTSNSSYQHLQMQYSADGTTWTNFDDEPTLDPSDWNVFEFTGVPAGNYYIAINASQADIRMFYGGELPLEPKMVVTQPASLDFGAISENTTKTFTIANTGRATLEGINVTSSNSAVFSISGAPTSLEAGASQEVTITMGTAQTGGLSSEITVSATGMEDVTFTVIGAVVPEGLMVVDFNDNQLPAGWGNNASSKWSFADGKAYCTYSAELTTPKLQFAEGDLLVISATSYDDYDNNYLEIYGSADGTNWDVFEAKKYISRSQIPYGSYANLIVTGIPTTTKYLKFKGYYVRIDEIAGLTYAPNLAVTLNEETVASPTSYDFGEKLNENATVTYNFANVGAGTINITNVVITGDGAAAYSTNWTASVAVPFDLVITRTYDGTRTGVQEAVVTVTTSDGDFVINVSGSDQGLNAPELSIDATPIDFGRLTANDTKTVTVTNAGTGQLTVNIASDNEQFTVSPAQLTDIAAGESKTFDVTFNYSGISSYGAQTANITVTPTYDEAANVIISAMAYAKNPNVWSEEFADADIEARGWTKDNWSITDGKAVGNSGSGYLYTPYLEVTDANEELTVDYEITSSFGAAITYQVSTDRGASWSAVKYYPTDYAKTYQALPNGDKGTFTITVDAVGVYQFRFQAMGYNLDNFEGFKRFVPAHDAEITAVDIPTNGYENREYTTTVTVKEKLGKEETATATLYFGDNMMATAEMTLTANAETTAELSFTPTEAMSTQTAKIVVTYEGGKLTSTTKSVTINAVVVYAETAENTINSGTNHIVLNRTFINGWNTICLPFAVSDPVAVFGEGIKVYEFNSYSTSDGLGFKAIKLTNGMEAKTPYLLYIPETIDVNDLKDIFFPSAWVSTGTPNVTKNNVNFTGTYTPITAGNLPAGSYVLTPEAKIAKAGSGASLKAFRAYFTTTGEARMTINFDDNTTAIGAITTDGELEVGTLYNLKGQKVKGNQKGLYIINGKKVVVK